MKKLRIFMLIFVLCLSLVACRRGNNNETTGTTTEATNSSTTETTLLPQIDPTLDTNIPDPDVDTSMPDGTDIFDETQNTTDNQNNTTAEGRNMPY